MRGGTGPVGTGPDRWGPDRTGGCSKRFTISPSHIHTPDGGVDHAARREHLGVRCLAQGHLDTPTPRIKLATFMKVGGNRRWIKAAGGESSWEERFVTGVVVVTVTVVVVTVTVVVVTVSTAPLILTSVGLVVRLAGSSRFRALWMLIALNCSPGQTSQKLYFATLRPT